MGESNTVVSAYTLYKINRNRASMIATLSLFIENIYGRYWRNITFYWRNITFLPPDRGHPKASSFLRLLVLCLVGTCSKRITVLFIFSKNTLLSLAPFTNAPPAFSTF